MLSVMNFPEYEDIMLQMAKAQIAGDKKKYAELNKQRRAMLRELEKPISSVASSGKSQSIPSPARETNQSR